MFPDRIEKVIHSNPSVEVCCVIGVKDKSCIHYPKAFVVLKEDKKYDDIFKEVYNLCENNLPDYMIPDDIEVIDVLPHTSRGKIDYRALEEKRCS